MTGESPKSAPPRNVPREHLEETFPELVAEAGLTDADLHSEPEIRQRLAEIASQLDDGALDSVTERLRDAIQKQGPDIQAFAENFSLTVTETALLEDLLAGITVVEHAELRNVSVNTARTHMRRLLEKTGTAGQLDLVRLVHEHQ